MKGKQEYGSKMRGLWQGTLCRDLSGNWEAEKEADEDMETDRVKTFDSVEELINDLG